jgi:aminocarboxymuconate-semialdehyde decarboxylase
MKYDDGRFFRAVEANCWCPAQRLREMDATGVDVQVLSTVPVHFNYGAPAPVAAKFARFLNDDLARVVAEHPTRFVGLGTLPLQDPALAVAELHHCAALGLRGVQIGSHVDNVTLDDARFAPLFQACVDLNLAVFVHPWDMDNSGCACCAEEGAWRRAH